MTPSTGQFTTSPSSAPRVDEPRWHAMRVTFRRELSVKLAIDDQQADDVETFIPMQPVMKLTRRGNKTRVLEPAVHNLLFVKARRGWLQQFKSRLPHLQYMTMRCDGRNEPIVVSDSDMERFIAVSRSGADDAIYLTPGEVNLSRGTRVRLHGGPLDGIEAIYVKLDGKRNKRIVVEIPNVISVATAIVTPDFIEVIPS